MCLFVGVSSNLISESVQDSAGRANVTRAAFGRVQKPKLREKSEHLGARRIARLPGNARSTRAAKEASRILRLRRLHVVAPRHIALPAAAREHDR